MAAASVRTKRAVIRRPGGRSARVRTAVFEATLELLASGGYRALTIEAVAKAAGVNKTTVYRNWPTRTALVLAAAEDRSEGQITTRSTGHPERDLVAFLKSVADNVTSPLGHALVLATFGEADDLEARSTREAFWRHRFEAAGPLIRAAADGRRLSRAEADHFIEMLIGPVYLRAFVTGLPVDDGFIRRTVRDVVRAAG